MRLTILFVLACCIQTAAGQSMLRAEDDFFDTNTDSSLTISGPGLLENDALVDDSLVVVLVSDPTNGKVVINQDGSFTYTPDPSFNGIDEFTYRIETRPMQVLEIDSLQSLLTFFMKVDIPIVGDDGDDAEGRIGGTTYLYVNDDQGQLYDMSLQVLDPLELDFRFGGLVTIARLSVDAAPGAFQLNQSQRSEPSEIVDGLFRQDSAKVQVMGTVDLDGSGVIGGQIPDDPQDFDTETDAPIEIQLTIKDSTITAEVPVNFAEEFELSGVDVDMLVEGTLIAEGPFQEPVESNVATVLITIDPISRASTEDERPFTYALAQNYPNPFNPTTTISYTIQEPEFVRLSVYDLLGREVAVLVNEVQIPGIHQVQFDASALSSGMYVYRIESGGFTDAKTLAVVK